jgi:hypothetical protein
LLTSLFKETWSRLYGRLRAREPNLTGDRDVEWSWIAGHIPANSGEALDFGNGGSSLGLAAAQRGYKVTAVDLERVTWPYAHPRLRFIQGDIRALPFERAQFDLVLSCSTVEHVGLAGRYGVATENLNGDLEAMARLREIMKPGATMLMSIPVGQDAVFAPYCRVYGKRRLPTLLSGYAIEEEQYWVKDDQNKWMSAERRVALAFQADAGSWTPLRNVYALGLFVLRPMS